MADYLKADLFLREPFDGSVSFNTPVFEIESYSHIWVHVEYSADADTASALAFRFSLDPNALAVAPVGVAYPPAAGFYSPDYLGGTVLLTSLTASGFTFSGRTAQGGVWFKFQNPPPNMQLIYTRLAGTRQFLVSVFGRSA